MRASTLLVLALLLAGCAGGPGARDGGAAPGAGDAAAPFLAPADLSGRAGGPEPVVVVAPGGAVWVAAQDAAGGAPRVWVSEDGARTFRASRPSSVGGGEVDLAVGAGVAFVTQLGPNGNVVSYSRDGGATWTQSAFAGTNHFERELVALDAAGSVYLASRFGLRSLTGGEVEDDAATIARSDDGGVTFVPVGRAWDAEREPGTSIGNMVADGASLFIAYNCRDGHGVCFARSVDRGATWTQGLVAQRAVDVANVYPVVAVDGARAWIAWSDASDGRLAVWGASSTDAGATWTPPVRLSEEGNSATLPWIAAGGGALWLVHLEADAALADAGAPEASAARWRAVAARLSPALAVEERALLLAEPVHEGVISKPVGRAGADGPFDRRFGDLFTVAVGPDGRAFAAVLDTTRGGAHVLVVAERAG